MSSGYDSFPPIRTVNRCLAWPDPLRAGIYLVWPRETNILAEGSETTYDHVIVIIVRS